MAWRGRVEVADAEGGVVVDGVEFEEEGCGRELGEAAGDGWNGIGLALGGVRVSAVGSIRPRWAGPVERWILVVGGGACGLRAGERHPVGQVEPAILGLQGGRRAAR